MHAVDLLLTQAIRVPGRYQLNLVTSRTSPRARSAVWSCMPPIPWAGTTRATMQIRTSATVEEAE